MTGEGPLRPVTNSVPSLINYLHDKYHEWLKETAKQKNEEAQPATLGGYLEFCNAYLAKNPPANPTYMANGLGVRMANGDYVSLSVPQLTPQMRDEGIHITIPQSVPGMHGVSDTSGISILGNR